MPQHSHSCLLYHHSKSVYDTISGRTRHRYTCPLNNGQKTLHDQSSASSRAQFTLCAITLYQCPQLCLKMVVKLGQFTSTHTLPPRRSRHWELVIDTYDALPIMSKRHSKIASESAPSPILELPLYHLRVPYPVDIFVKPINMIQH